MPKAQTQAKEAKPEHRPSRPVGIHLLHVVDAYLRKKQRGKGDLSKLIMEAVSRTDLRLVPLITIHGRRQPTVAKVTQIVMPKGARSSWKTPSYCASISPKF